VKTACFVTLFGLAMLGAAGAEEKKSVPVYTNEDLDRLSPYRGQTGVLSESSVESASVPTPRASAPEPEAYWRREAARVREQVRALDEKAEEIRRELREARRATPPPWSSRPRRVATPNLGPREARLKALEERIRALEVDLADRARRAGALPGWLR